MLYSRKRIYGKIGSEMIDQRRKDREKVKQEIKKVSVDVGKVEEENLELKKLIEEKDTYISELGEEILALKKKLTAKGNSNGTKRRN